MISIRGTLLALLCIWAPFALSALGHVSPCFAAESPADSNATSPVTADSPSATQARPRNKTHGIEMDNYDQVIPKTPTTPPAFIQTIPVEKFICDRKFLYQGRILSCDSNLDADAERLRSIVQTTPAALKELDTYQKNRKEAVIHAYIGSVGLLTILTTFIISREMTDGNGNPTKEGTIIRNIGSLSGIAIAGGSFFLGLRALSQNEKHLGQAVKNFNDAHSDQPIELQFSTGVSF